MMHRSMAKVAGNTTKSLQQRVAQQNAVKALLTSKTQYPQIPKYSMMSQSFARQSFLMGSPMQVRLFSSLPSHIKLEMPNLTPTMEKVSENIFIRA